MKKDNDVKKENKGNILDENMSEKELRKQYGEKSTFQKVMNIILWIVLLAWMAIVLIDFYHVDKKEDPYFCINSGVTEYSDGNVKWCLGLGYKVYQYNRNCFTAIEFGPFWSKDRSLGETRCDNE